MLKDLYSHDKDPRHLSRGGKKGPVAAGKTIVTMCTLEF